MGFRSWPKWSRSWVILIILIIAGFIIYFFLNIVYLGFIEGFDAFKTVSVLVIGILGTLTFLIPIITGLISSYYTLKYTKNNQSGIKSIVITIVVFLIFSNLAFLLLNGLVSILYSLNLITKRSIVEELYFFIFSSFILVYSLIFNFSLARNNIKKQPQQLNKNLPAKK